ncbi:hypothetical protein MJO28_011020 [Puccinia striiformis f. sp. tritici]|uniref:Uncharacterized protein n=1 Tax=Puccinia striiformis f. sp. tritici TaxID=168172 RepID=A0ACC0E197_9BASI|nr:hypothetical protein MJO28_011020 [Puccinia striiformis f. sp. tritici]KAI7946240.1 hypothetical protein MJO29_010767 [Puccinia striiformis f. sp. tritici]
MAWPFSKNTSTSTSTGRGIHRSIHEEVDEDDEDDAQLLLPTSNGVTHKRIQRVKHSLSYLLISGGASFILVMMIWLGPGWVSHDPKGIATQSNAHVGYSEDNPNQNGKPIISVSANSSSRPKLSVSKPPIERKLLPHHSWNPLLYDSAPITHVFVKPCMFPPWAFKAFCTPHQTAREIALYGKWVRVPRDVSKGVGHYYTEIYYRRAQTLDVSSLDPKPVTGLQVLDEDEENDPLIKAKLAQEGWEVAGESLRTGVWPTKVKDAKLWLTRSTTFNGTVYQPITEINILWSRKSDLTQPWWGFERLNKPVFDGDNLMDHIQCDVVVRRQIVEPPVAPSLNFQKDGKFKIMQISDLHFSASGGKCISADQIKTCEQDGADLTTKKFLSKAIKEARPNLIVLGGDQLLGKDKTFDTISTLTKIGQFFSGEKVPWTVVFGNHDSDRSLAIEEQMYLFKHMPFFVGKAGPGVPGFEEEGLPAPLTSRISDMGVGNYILQVNASLSDPTQLLSLYFLDSHDYPRRSISQLWDLAMGGNNKFDWIKKSQIEWYKKSSNEQPRILRPYEPSQGYQDRSKSMSNTEKKKPIGLMFFHIPLPEAYGTADINPRSHGELVFGNQREGRLNAEAGDEFFKNAILTTPISDSLSPNTTSFEPEIKVIANGHAHATDTCRKHKGVYHCFSGLSSYSGALDVRLARGWERRVRVFEVSNFGEKVETFEIKHAIDTQNLPVVRLGSHLLFDSSSDTLTST